MLWCVLLMGISGITQGQSSFALSLDIGPSYSYRVLKGDESVQRIIDLRNESEDYGLGFTAGIAGHYKFKNGTQIELGIQYIRYVTRTNDLPVLGEFNEFIGTADLLYQSHFIEIPLRTRYVIHFMRYSVYISPGIAPSLFLNQFSKGIIEYDNGDSEVKRSENTITDFNDFGLVGLFGFGIEIPIGEKMRMAIEPGARYHFFELNDFSVKEHLYSFGCQFRLIKQF